MPPKVAFFAWEASWGKGLTQEQLQRGGSLWQIGAFFVYPKQKWWIISYFIVSRRGPVEPSLSLFGVSWTLSCTVKATLLGWNGGFVGKRRKRA